MGDDMRLKKAFDEPSPPTDLGGISYEILPAGTDGTITVVVAYPDEGGTHSLADPVGIRPARTKQ
ncbi:hypothetical protein ABIA35_003217 [Catenulispora sp. MAP12-49]